MQRIRTGFSLMAVAVALVFGMASTAAAQRVNTREVRDTLRSLNSKVDDLDYTLMFQLRSNSAGRQDIADAERSLENLKDKLRAFETNLDLRRENRNDINEIVTAAQDISGFLQANPQSRRIETIWTDVRTLIERLGANYGVTPDWSGRVSNASRDTDYRPMTTNYSRSDLTGTYRLDSARSENVADILGSLSVSATQRQDLEAKLSAPDQVALSIRGDQVTLASTTGTPLTFTADGREKTETVDGRNVRVRAALTASELTLLSLGGESDYTITFASVDGGRELKVTRRVTTEYLNETVFADSIYTKTDAVAGLGINDDGGNDTAGNDTGYSSNDPGDRVGANSPNPTLSQPRIGEFVVPNGVVLIALLDSEINTKASQNNDRFKMTVQSPMEYRGAVIEGYITGVGRSGQVSGRPNVTFNFERITLRDGKAYDFGGNLKGIKDQAGKDVKIDAEGTAKGDSQTKETAKRGGIGAGLGAIIGAIAGGGKGAVLGAIIGGGAGAGSVAIMGRDDIRLMPGSTITVESSSPIANGQPPNR